MEDYFAEILRNKKRIISYVVKEFTKVYKTKDDNKNYEKELNARLVKLKRTRQKYMDMYTDDLISREELNEKIGGIRAEIVRLENDIKLVQYNLDKGDKLEGIIKKTFQSIEDITSFREMTNEQLKKTILKIEVDKDGNVDIYLRLFGDLGLDQTVLINNNYT